jgi:hypothetical protein
MGLDARAEAAQAGSTEGKGMPIDQIEAFLRRMMTDESYCRRFLVEPEVALTETELDAGERWAVLEALREDDETGQEFLALLRTRLAIVGVHIGAPPADLERVFAVRRSDIEA